MRLSWLRAMVAGCLFSMTVWILLFQDMPGTESLRTVIYNLQLTPLMVKAVSGSITALIMAVALFTLTFAGGRLYCSFLCPLGIYQDGIIFLSRCSGRKPGRDLLPYPTLRHLVLGTTLFWAGGGSLFLVNLLDPFSLFGRMSVDLFIPVKTHLTNALVYCLESLDTYWIAPVKFPDKSMMMVLMSWAWLIAVTASAYCHGRLYCSSLCPVGTLLGILSCRAPVGVFIREESCTRCGRCANVCRSGCIDVPGGRIDAERCVVCFDCLDACPESAVAYAKKPLVPKNEMSVQARRKFLTNAAAGTAAVAAGIIGRKHFEIPQPLIPLLPITPAGSDGPDRFAARCTACFTCVGTCPTRVLQPRLSAFSSAGIMQPVLDFSKGPCSFTCNACTKACPSGAIGPLMLEDKQRTRIGSVTLNTTLCIVYVKHRDCGACAEVCPTHAVHTIKENRLNKPVLKQDSCIGCGACQHVCPVTPKAIFVTGIPRHEQAAPPYFNVQDIKSPSPPASKKGFPF